MTRRAVAIGCVALLAACSGSSLPKTRFEVVSAAMDPTIKAKASVRVYEGNYHPRRGDVIVFDLPPGESAPGISMTVKRVIGLPGDTNDARDGFVYLNGRRLNEPCLAAGIDANCGVTQAQINAVAAGYSEEYVLDTSSVERNDGWVMNFGSLKGQTPKGRVYIMKVTTSFNASTQPQQLNEVHVAILNGRAYMFSACK
jgi:signal peptidase I